MDAIFAIFPAEIFPFLSALLALIVLWQYHEKLVLTGRIQAIDIYDRSGIRMYIYAAPDDDQICAACRDAHGRVFLTSTVARKDFTPLREPCTNPQTCTTVLLGLYGAWPEARGVVDRLRAARKIGSIQLSPEEVRAVIKGRWEQSVSAATDRFAIHMLGALGFEKSHPETAILQYRMIIDQVKEVRHLLLLVPTYLRLTELLARHGRVIEAQQVIEQFDLVYAPHKGAAHYPSSKQRGVISLIKSRLASTPKRAYAAAPAAR